MRLWGKAALTAGLIAAGATAGVAADSQSDYIKAVIESITDRHPATTQTVNHDNLTVHRLDIVDDKGVVRMTLAGKLPDPVVDGVAYSRSRPVGGLMLRDNKGNERGGIGYASGFGPIIALDHNNGEAAGFNVQPDGSVGFVLAAHPAALRPKGADGHLIPNQGPTPIRMAVGPDGAPELVLADQKDKPRLVLTLKPSGNGAIRFLDAKGKILKEIAAPDS